MRWRDLLFAHWRVDAGVLAPHLPSGLELDTCDGSAWLGVVPFRMSGVSLRGLPDVPHVSAFPEINLRTYVTADGKPGVWFFSLDVPRRLAVWVARRRFHLPYFLSRMSCEETSGEIRYRMERTHRGAPAASFVGSYRPVGDSARSEPGSLEAFLTERYCLYASDASGRLYRGDIHHDPWPLQRGEAEIEENTLAGSLGVPVLDGEPLLHFARELEVVAWSIEDV